MRLKFPTGRYHLPRTPTSAHSSQWLLGGDNRLCTEGDRPHSWCNEGKRKDTWGSSGLKGFLLHDRSGSDVRQAKNLVSRFQKHGEHRECGKEP